ncbi:MAG: hypothetical protein ACE5JG_13500, partial [Planctomycetota bacterium]
MRGPIPAVLLMPVLGLGACATPGTSPERFSQTQLNDIETREVEAGLDETFTAASHALFDAGYTIAMSDRQGGLLTGVRGVDRTWHRVLISKYIRDTAYAISIQIRAEAPRRCSVRVKLSV